MKNLVENSVKTSVNQFEEKVIKMELRQAKKEIATSISMKVQIMEKTENGFIFKLDNKKFGFIKENRPIQKTQVSGFLQIIHNNKYDDSQSIVTIEASKLTENYNIVDLEGNAIPQQEISEYLVVLDGQHRISAFSKLNSIRKPEDQILIPNVYIKENLNNVREYLSNINTVGHHWTTSDKLCVSAISTENKILKKINELIKDGYNASTAFLICTGKKITAKQLKQLISKGDTSCLPNEETALERAEEFLTTALAIDEMTSKILTKRYFIKGFNSFAKSRTLEEALLALSKLTIEDFKTTKEDDEFIEKLNIALTV